MPLEHCLHTGPVQSSAQRTNTHMHECVHSYTQTCTLAMLSNLRDGEVLVVLSEYWIPLAVVYGRYSCCQLWGLEWRTGLWGTVKTHENLENHQTYTTIQKFGVSKFLFLFFSTKNNHFIPQKRIKLIKSDSKDIYNVTKDFCIKLILFFW